MRSCHMVGVFPFSKTRVYELVDQGALSLDARLQGPGQCARRQSPSGLVRQLSQQGWSRPGNAVWVSRHKQGEHTLFLPIASFTILRTITYHYLDSPTSTNLPRSLSVIPRARMTAALTPSSIMACVKSVALRLKEIMLIKRNGRKDVSCTCK